MLSSNEGDNDVFFDSIDSLSPQDCGLTKQEFSSEYEIWVNEPLSVKERRGRFLQAMGLFETSASKISSQEKMVNLERIKECSGAVSNACNLVLSGCKAASETEALFDGLKGRPQLKPDVSFERKVHELSFTGHEHRHRETEAREECRDFEMGIKKKKKKWWFKKVGEGKVRSKLNTGTNRTHRVKVRQNKKRWLEFSGLYIGQQIRAHQGLIWTMKFSPNGHYLASGGDDGVVRIWHVISLDTSSICFTTEDSTASKLKFENSYHQKNLSNQSFIFLPNKVFQIEESPLQEFYGHFSDVLDLAWSNSDVSFNLLTQSVLLVLYAIFIKADLEYMFQILLSSSMDRTVRLWKIGCNQCLSVFHHNDYVTCIQFNPVDENYFISGSIDGKVRIWGIREERVVDWADIRDVISAISYQKDAKRFVVGSVTGTCHFYVASVFPKNHQRIMITSEDSKIRIFDGIKLIHKYRGLPKSGSHMHGSFTSNGKHIISVGEDSHVYIWNHNDTKKASTKQKKTEYSCEYFFSKGVTIAIPWSGMNAEQKGPCSNFVQHHSSELQNQLEVAAGRDSERFSLGSWFSIDGTCRGSTTWPEEKLPCWDLPLAKEEYEKHKLYHKDTSLDRGVPETWGLSIVAAGCDGTIKTFHNFGLPIRL
ncbi:putative transcription factor WD40-like family [Lupinus albus]|uniref:Putative transcription factor WD40-like family n=1 Tax=Lupinus albus TaxID=3870 RepID=A0A6A4MRT7_LUPAL|nr:putative transcription factor WD40-like family [Lupinus albus]